VGGWVGSGGRLVLITGRRLVQLCVHGRVFWDGCGEGDRVKVEGRRGNGLSPQFQLIHQQGVGS
jgi:hypothetical protein